MFVVHNYKVTVNSDTGSFKVDTVATSEEAAKKIIMKGFNCPESAIKKIVKGEEISKKYA